MDYSKILEYLRSEKGKIMYGILSSWYTLVAIPAVIVTYNILTNDTVQKVLKHAYDDLDQMFTHLIERSVTCPSKILDFLEFFNCITR